MHADPSRRTTPKRFYEVSPRTSRKEINGLLKYLSSPEKYLKRDPFHAPAIHALARVGIRRHDLTGPCDDMRALIVQARDSFAPESGAPHRGAAKTAFSSKKPRDDHARVVAACARRAYEDLTGRCATRIVRRVDHPFGHGDAYVAVGPYIDFLKQVFVALGLSASAANRAKR